MAVRESYGMTLFGQACLAARRLVQAGGKFVTVFWDEFGLALAESSQPVSVWVGLGDLDDVEALSLEALQVAVLVLEPAPGQNLELRVLPHRSVQRTGGDPPVEHREVPARQVAHKIGGAHDQLALDALHCSPSARDLPDLAG